MLKFLDRESVDLFHGDTFKANVPRDHQRVVGKRRVKMKLGPRPGSAGGCIGGSGVAEKVAGLKSNTEAIAIRRHGR